MALIDEWKRAWRYFSVQANALGVALSAAYGLMYGQLKETLPPTAVAAITGTVFVLGIVGRLTAQAPPPPDKPGGAEWK